MKLFVRPSPNQSDRVHGDDAVRLVVCHTPEGSYDGTVRYLQSRNSRVSYHRLYKKDGSEATQFVQFSRKAWHAGAVNSLSDGLAVEGHARFFDLSDPGTRNLARGVAERLVARNLPCQWTTDPAKGGFCRHGDLQADRSDPTPDLREWRMFVAMVREEYEALRGWPRPVPAWFWAWARWWLGHSEFRKWGPRRGPRPKGAPRLIPPWAWRRLRALVREAKK